MTAEEARKIPNTGPQVGPARGAGAGRPRGGGRAGAPVRRGAGRPGAAQAGRAGGMAPGGGMAQGSGYNCIFVGSKGYMGTSGRGEGVGLLPGSRWADYTLPPQFLTRSPGHQRDWIRACKGGAPACSQFEIAAPYTEWLVLGLGRGAGGRQAALRREDGAVHEQRRGQQAPAARLSQGLGRSRCRHPDGADREDHPMDYTRREFGKLALATATLPLAPWKLMAAAKPNSVFGGVQIGTITYSFRSLPSSAEETLKYCVDCGISGIELMSNVAEGYAGAPNQGRGGVPGRAAARGRRTASGRGCAGRSGRGWTAPRGGCRRGASGRRHAGRPAGARR